MVITLVMDQYVGDDGKITNGTTMTTLRFAKKLQEFGNEVRIVTCTKNSDDNVYVVPEYHFWFLDKIIHEQGMAIAKPDKKTMREAFQGSDVVHFLMPFFLARKGKKIADEMGIATTCAFHVQSENMTFSVGLGNMKWANEAIYRSFRGYYNKFGHIHCPSKMIADQLAVHKYTGKTHVISNGVDKGFKPEKVERPKEYEGKIVVMMIGRYSKEKRQDLIIKAISESKYKDKMVLVLCGVGPEKENLQKLAKAKGVSIEFKFLSQPELVKLCNYADVYVHASDAEIEAIACIEAFSCGMVPIISDSKISATNQFALSDKNLFKQGDYMDLRDKIEYLIEHEEEKEKLSRQYVEYAKQFALDNCVRELEKVFRTAIQEKANE